MTLLYIPYKVINAKAVFLVSPLLSISLSLIHRSEVMITHQHCKNPTNQSKMFSKSPDLVRNSLQIQINKQQEEEDKYYLSSRSSILSKENNPSFRFYNNYDGAVPFLWESRPGTPKCSFNETTLIPPLTPPPSYFNSNEKSSSSSSSSPRSRSSKLLHVLFPKMMNLKKSNSSVSSSSLSFSSSSSSPSSNLSTVVPVSTSPKKYYQHRLRGGRRGLSFDSRVDYHDEEEDIIGSSPTSTLCFFGIGKGN
ncbi:hypothetical protein Dsin_007327 [Dipteronia sinensis]|uniref:Uncharacterized protein n=1 Tax=Dipteronia sinensis TaxID=43782 RepID=A0AAE0B0X9_9ROSI|nr:hypothetical protein Dsin_007327 [Dipteronia sinensis]